MFHIDIGAELPRIRPEYITFKDCWGSNYRTEKKQAAPSCLPNSLFCTFVFMDHEQLAPSGKPT